MRVLWAIGVVAAICAPALATGISQSIETYPAIQIDQGRRLFVEDPSATVSDAWLDRGMEHDKSGVALEPAPGWRAYARVIVRVNTDEDAAALAGEYEVAQIGELRDGFTIETPSIAAADELAKELAHRPGVWRAVVDVERPWGLRGAPSDPSYSQQWHLNNTINPVADADIEPAWMLGYTGQGIGIGIVESTWQTGHPDLVGNYDPNGSQAAGVISSHATSVAGVAGAVANNGLGGAGAAYDARLSTIRNGTTSTNATAFGYRNIRNDIKNNSWGPLDINEIWEMSTEERDALAEAVTNGRNGKGEIFVWAGGNGGTSQDRADYDPYTSSRFTISVGAITDADVRASYSELSSSHVCVTHSNGGTRSIYTTTSGSNYTSSFGGTSASAPLASGIIALMLEADPNLTWRDVQHIIIESARKNDPGNADWTTNAAGYDISYMYGFGALDALSAIQTTLAWTPVEPETSIESNTVVVNTQIPDSSAAGLTRTVYVDDLIEVETVELIVNVTSDFIGDLEITLTSPYGTTSILTKKNFDAGHALTDHIFTSFRDWGEPSKGEWTVKIADRAPTDLSTWVDFHLAIHGTPRCFSDVNDDGAIGLEDLAGLLAGFGVSTGAPGYDVWLDPDQSGTIDLSDLAALLSLFGTSCP
ncbi:MAG: S8 family serine peptidase [Phycisphaerales bacterium]|nr:S8 family serine peptidase [Phycisphaerales bacterium]